MKIRAFLNLFSSLAGFVLLCPYSAAALSPKSVTTLSPEQITATSSRPALSDGVKMVSIDADADGYAARTDCDDGNAEIHPDRKDCRNPLSGAQSSSASLDGGVTGVDDDCDGKTDEDWICLDVSNLESSEDGNETVSSARTFPTNEGARLTQIPFFENSSMTAGVEKFSGGSVAIMETGASVRYDDGSWARVVFEEYRGRNDDGFGTAVEDPNVPGTFYGCTGSNNAWDESTILEYATSYMGNIVRFDAAHPVDDAVKAQRIAGDLSKLETYVFGCVYGSEGRGFIEEETGLEIWYTASQSPLIAFNPRITAAGYSRSFYFMTHILGPVRVTLDETAEYVENVEFLDEDLDPDLNLYDTGTADYGDGFSDDDYVFTYGEAGEPNRIGAFLIADSVHLANVDARGLDTETVLYAGYYDNSSYEGGLQRLIVAEDGSVESEDWIVHPNTGLPLDARDMDCLDDAVALSDGSGRTLASACLVAAGADGVFLLRTAADGSMTLTDVAGSSAIVDRLVDEADGSVLTREHYVSLCPSASGGCSDIASYFITDADVEEIDGIPYALLSASRKVYLANLSDLDNIRWIELPSDNVSHAVGSALDKNGRRILYGNNNEIELDAVLSDDGTATWEETPRYADRNGFDVSVDPRDSNRVVGTSLDGTALLIKYDENYEAVETIFSDDGGDGEIGLRSTEFGMCYGVLETEDTSGIATGDHVDDEGASHYASYGMTVRWAEDPNTGEWIGYVAADHYDGSDGAIYKLLWDEATGTYHAETALGLKDCVNAYPDWNHSETTCLTVCESNPDGRSFPNGTAGDFAVTPKNANNLLVVSLIGGGTPALWRSTDGGSNWDDISYKYVYGPTGASLSLLGNPSIIVAHPNDTEIFYLAYEQYGVYKLDLRAGSATLFSHTTASGNPNDPAMPAFQDRTFTTLGETISYTPYVYDMKVASDPTTGFAKVYVALQVFSDVGWGKWPTSEGTAPNAGGIYVIIDDGTGAPGTKLNFVGDYSNPIQNFMSYRMAISSDGQSIVAVGNVFDWSCQGNPPYLSGGVLYSNDGGATWQHAIRDGYSPNLNSVAADPNDSNRFIIGMKGDGIWELKLE